LELANSARIGAQHGGLLFGEQDDSAGVIWVSEVSEPPPDSSGSAEEFVCGVEGRSRRRVPREFERRVSDLLKK
jgi:hypothetical protein